MVKRKWNWRRFYENLEFQPNKAQGKAIEEIEKPQLIITGPGAGKTQVLILRALNLLLNKEVKPENIMLCFFTEKTATQLKEILKFGLIKCDVDDFNIFDLTVGTINSICDGIVTYSKFKYRRKK